MFLKKYSDFGGGKKNNVILLKKKFALCATTKIYILTLVLSEKKFRTKKKPIVPPLQVKWSVPNQIQIDELHAEDIHLHDPITVRSDESFRLN